ncbi:RING finger domain-containing protein [Sporormia fimetaria CBS 119925]|uniref:E3 ubiquitin-protein ligase n=1 Tax=Sporormia fimetaria CBS 119925 TaxID=1340428 RepID=A0A6A6UZ66_9PLEO|nr:RING finger domain-containing protein [Sporormia fimetaria CBS 119925]
MLVSPQDQRLCTELRNLPARHNFFYTEAAKRDLIRSLFESLAGRPDYLPLLFPDGPPHDPETLWSLRDAQGAVEGAEYTAAARGKPCGHIFKSGEATYRCKTCGSDDTCVLCTRCFDGSDHEGHQVYVTISPGNAGCCDCGDQEAWLRPLHCNIHSPSPDTASTAAGKAKQGASLPADLIESIRVTIARVLDYSIDVFSCSPEQLRLTKSEESIVEDERTSRLTSKWYSPGDVVDPDQTFALVLWNDEKHTVQDVRDQVARACKKKPEFGLAKAHEVHQIGRSVVIYGNKITDLLRMAKIIEEIKLTVTIRSARDTFREQMCETIIEWLSDISGCCVGDDTQILRRTICEEFLRPWRVGSAATHQSIGQDGLDDHEAEEMEGGAAEVLHQILRMQQRDRRRAQAANNGDTTASDDDDAEDQAAEAESIGEGAENMDIDEFLRQDRDGDIDMESYDVPDEALEVSEATMAGYPPPPPPPLAGQVADTATPAESDTETTHRTLMSPSIFVPETPRNRHVPLRSARAPDYWLVKPESYGTKPDTPLHEDLWRRLRLDYLILYDMRMWKNLRTGIRDLLLSTVVSIPEFKRLLGLRFAGVYTALAQLYLIADREPDHSIINLSLQMVTTPSITAEILERGNFLTNLMAILYTFLTTRQVGHPSDVDPSATLAFEAGAVTNRRMYHFFLDMKFLLGSEHVQDRIREEEQYLRQFLDLVKLHQGICPNVRAVGEHVEFETEAWISASLITREINKLCRQFAEAFKWRRDEDPTNIRRALRRAAKIAIINSLGVERLRFDQSEIKQETSFKILPVFEFDADPSTFFGPSYTIVGYNVANEPMSFHHALQYTLSWLIDHARSMERDHLLGLLLFSSQELRESQILSDSTVPDRQPEDYLLAVFDFPLRVCAWLAQMRAGTWVRNGVTLRHQMTQYRSVSQRDVSYHRDIFLLQVAFVLCNPSAFLATMIDRFGILDWMRGKWNFDQPDGFEDAQTIDIVEDFVHLLIILLSERTHLIPLEDDPDQHIAAIRRDIAHVLCFKPLSFSELTSRLPERVHSADSFQDIISEMTTFRPPEGLSDNGTFALKEHFLDLVDPYAPQYTRNQREEAETIYRNYMAKKTGKLAAEVVFEPTLKPIRSGVFQGLSEFTRQPLFTQVVYYLLAYALAAPAATPSIPMTRVETYLQTVLQLFLVAVIEDQSEPHTWSESDAPSFATSVLTKRAAIGYSGHDTVLSLLKSIMENDVFKSCVPRIIQILHHLKQRQPDLFVIASEALHLPTETIDTASSNLDAMQEKEIKKKLALERQARVMASFKQDQAKFMANQDFDWGEDEDSDDYDSAALDSGREKTIEYPSGTCVLCRESANDQKMYGTFGYVSESRLLRLTDIKDADWVEEVTDTPVSLDRSADSLRPFGVAGKNKTIVEKITATGEKVTIERQELGKGFPCTQTRPGPVSTGCGHIMHFSCFENFLQATQRRHVSQIARNHPERPDLKEFQCPLCKALGNMFLPIIWKPKKVSYPGRLETKSTFEDWIPKNDGSNFPWRLDGPGGSSSIMYDASRQRDVFLDYGAQVFIEPITTRLSDLSNPVPSTVPVAPDTLFIPPGNTYQVFTGTQLLEQLDDARNPVVPASENNPSSTQEFQVSDLRRIYQRLRDTFRANSIISSYPNTPADIVDDLTHTDAIAKALGYSIFAVEIAQRGVQSESSKGTLIDNISAQSLTHLRIYSETVSTYLAVGAMRSQGATKTMDEYLHTMSDQIRQLCLDVSQVQGPNALPYGLKSIPSLLAQDPFIFLSELSVGIVPAYDLDIHHLMRLCYLAEMVRVVLAFVVEGADETEIAKGLKTRIEDGRLINAEKINGGFSTEDQLKSMLVLVASVYKMTASNDSSRAVDPDELDLPDLFRHPAYLYFICTMASTYALAFVRKAAILMHVRYGVEFPHLSHEQASLPELDRLSILLKLPSLPELLGSFAAKTDAGYATRYVVLGWIRHWMWTREGKRPVRPTIELSHPAIFELIGLPKTYDSLTDEAIRRKCPTTGKELSDPALCLLCGEFMCSQAVCCMTRNGGRRGGCNKHQTKCGGPIGIYILIRKCMVLFLNRDHGSFVMAPYLDKHGEADPTLRRHQQLFLNQKRYDALLRKVWLEGGIQSLIARKLDGDVNNGGWETL